MKFFFQEDSAFGADALCVQHSPTAAAPSTAFLLNHDPSNSLSWMHWSQGLGNHTAAWVWVVSRTDWENQGATGWILAMHWYSMRFSCLPVLPGSAEAQVTWGSTVKRLLIACFIGNISAKKYQNAFTYVKVVANQRWTFLRHIQCTWCLQGRKSR